METKSLSNLKANPKNPRTISKHDFKSLGGSMGKFGDLSGIIFNVTTDQLVGGHQRTKRFEELKVPEIVITERYEKPNSVGTIAHGYVMVGDEKFTYREVQWDAVTEKAANTAANRIGGEFDQQLLAEQNYEIAQADNGAELLELSGQSDQELKHLNDLIGVGGDGDEDNQEDEKPASDKREIRATKEQWETIDEALEYVKAHREIPAEDAGSRNGSALYYLARDFLEKLHAAAESEPAPPAGERLDQPPVEVS